MNENINRTELKQDGEDTLAGIGGWLILPAIGLIIVPIIGAISLFTGLNTYQDVARAGYGGVYALELIVLLGLLVFTIYAAVQFFGKEKNAPKIIIALCYVDIIASLVIPGIELLVGAKEFAAESGRGLFRDIVIAAIWIHYFSVSRRVKATFVN
jgi:hypothetical protein